jgi:hypothetical protein
MIEKMMGWVCATTLKNKILAINISKIRRIWLLDDACDAPDDWSTEAIEDYSGHPLDVYRGVDAFFSDSGSMTEESSSAYNEIIKDFIKEKKLDQNNIYDFLHYTNIYMTDGFVTSYWVNSNNLHDIVFNIDLDFLPKILAIHEFGGFESYYPTDSLAVIEMPLIDVIKVAKAVQEEVIAVEKEEERVKPSAPTDSTTAGSRIQKKGTRKPRLAD